MQQLRIFRGRKGMILKAVMNAIIPRGGAFKTGALDFDLLPKAERYIKSLDFITQKLFPLILWQIEFSALLYKGKVFTRLPASDAADFLKKLEQSVFYNNRGVVMLVKLLTTLTFFDIDEAALEIEYMHGCHLEEKRKSGAVYVKSA